MQAICEYIRYYLLSLPPRNDRDRVMPPWTWPEMFEEMRYFVEDEQSVDNSMFAAGEIEQFDHSIERDDRERLEAVVVVEMFRTVVRGIDLAFSFLRLEGWALRRYLAVFDAAHDERDRNTENDEEERIARGRAILAREVRLRHLPTLYDCLIEYS